MTANKILKSLTPERSKKELAEIQAVELPADLQKWVKEYEKVGDRDKFIAKWMYKGDLIIAKAFAIDSFYSSSFIKNIFLLHIFTNLIDDISEKINKKDLLYKLLNIPFGEKNISSLNINDKKYFLFSKKVLDEIKKELRLYKNYNKFEELFFFDLMQIINTTRYTAFTQKNKHLLNSAEYWQYSPNNMQIMVVFDIYLMVYDIEEKKQTGILREFFSYAQNLLRIGNDLGTWEREMHNNDFNNFISVFAYTSNQNFLEENEQNKTKIIEQDSIQNHIKERLKYSREKMKSIINTHREISKPSMPAILNAIEKINDMHLIGRGRI